MTASAQDLLDDVNAALSAILEGQVESLSSRAGTLAKLPIDKLFDMRMKLSAEVSYGGGSMSSLGFQTRPS